VKISVNKAKKELKENDKAFFRKISTSQNGINKQGVILRTPCLFTRLLFSA